MTFYFKVIAIGITNDAEMAELSLIASAPYTKSINQVTDFDDLTTLVDTVLDTLCTIRYISQI